jgi:hypothetical protein
MNTSRSFATVFFGALVSLILPLTAFAVAVSSVNFDPLASITYGDPAPVLSAVSSSEPFVSFSIISGGGTVCGLDGDLFIYSAGTCTIRASDGTNSVDQVLTILPRGITIVFTANNKPYDGNTSAVIASSSIATSSMIVVGEVVTVSGGIASFADPLPGMGKSVTAATSSFTLGGGNAGNYTISSVTPTTADITGDLPPTIVSGGGGTSSGGNGPIAGSLGGGNTGGQVLGASTSTISTATTTPSSCGPYLTSYLRLGWDNPQDQVDKLRAFLISHEGASISPTGAFDLPLFRAVVAFQIKHMLAALNPWRINSGTGFVYKTTLYSINHIMCPTLSDPAPTNLVPWSASQ